MGVDYLIFGVYGIVFCGCEGDGEGVGVELVLDLLFCFDGYSRGFVVD